MEKDGTREDRRREAVGKKVAVRSLFPVGIDSPATMEPLRASIHHHPKL